MDVTIGELHRSIQLLRTEVAAFRADVVLRSAYDERQAALNLELREIKKDTDRLDARVSAAEKKLWAQTGAAATVGGSVGAGLAAAIQAFFGG